MTRSSRPSLLRRDPLGARSDHQPLAVRLWRRARPGGGGGGGGVGVIDPRLPVEAFVRRAAADAVRAGTTVLEVGSAGQGHQAHFPADGHRWLALPPGRPGGTLAELPVGDEQFALALWADVSAGGHEPLGVLGEINRALGRAGLLYLVAPLIVPDDLVVPWRTRYGLNYLLEASGFGIEDLQPLASGRRYGIVARKLRRPGHPELAGLSGRADLLRP